MFVEPVGLSLLPHRTPVFNFHQSIDVSLSLLVDMVDFIALMSGFAANVDDVLLTQVGWMRFLSDRALLHTAQLPRERPMFQVVQLLGKFLVLVLEEVFDDFFRLFHRGTFSFEIL